MSANVRIDRLATQLRGFSFVDVAICSTDPRHLYLEHGGIMIHLRVRIRPHFGLTRCRHADGSNLIWTTFHDYCCVLPHETD